MWEGPGESRERAVAGGGWGVAVIVVARVFFPTYALNTMLNVKRDLSINQKSPPIYIYIGVH